MEDFDGASIEVDVAFELVANKKVVIPIAENRMSFLVAAKNVIDKMKDYWPLSIRQIHYHLLNGIVYTMEPKRSKYNKSHFRYRNNEKSYKSLSRLLTQARYLDLIPYEAIGDPTRPEKLWGGFKNVDQFIEREVANFMCGYHRNRQQGQPRHIEVLGEKNTILTILERATREYYVPLTIGRGFSGPSIWKRMAKRFAKSGKQAMSLIVCSDLDPEGLALAEDAIRSLRDMWGIPLDYHRVGVTREQVDEMGLANDYNPAKKKSPNLNAFIKKTGGKETWECEALPPDYLIEQVKAAIESNMDMDIYRDVIDRELEDCNTLHLMKTELSESMMY